jgi:hypothetical protein
MKLVAYQLLVLMLGTLAWAYPFLFELPILGAIAGAYWLFFRESGES